MDIALLVIGILAAAGAAWLALAGTRPQDVADEEPTLNTRGRGR